MAGPGVWHTDSFHWIGKSCLSFADTSSENIIRWQIIDYRQL